MARPNQIIVVERGPGHGWFPRRVLLWVLLLLLCATTTIRSAPGANVAVALPLVVQPPSYMYMYTGGQVVKFDAFTGARLQAFGGSGFVFSPSLAIGTNHTLYFSSRFGVTAYNSETGLMRYGIDFTSVGHGRGDTIATQHGVIFVPGVDTLRLTTVARFAEATGAYLGDFLLDLQPNPTIRRMKIGPDGLLYLQCYDGSTPQRQQGYLIRLNPQTGMLVDIVLPSESFFAPFAFGPDQRLYLMQFSRTITQHDPQTLARLATVVDEAESHLSEDLSWPSMVDLAFGPDGNLYIVDGPTGEVQRYDGHTGAYRDTFLSSTMGVTRTIGVTLVFDAHPPWEQP